MNKDDHLQQHLELCKRIYDRYLQRGEAGLQDQSPKPKHVWNRIPDEVRRRVVDLALE
jgi:putative transposase